jgi:hypothetical protein
MHRGSVAGATHQQQQQQQQQQQTPMQQQHLQQEPSSYFDPTQKNKIVTATNNDDFPGGAATYEETYGDAYTGGRMVYVYPSGYQSMRPRSCPWKLSIIVCLLFTWLSIFIVGHCADQFDYEAFIESIKNNSNNAEQNSTSSSSYSSSSSSGGGYKIDDEAIQTQWCGSRPLYLMWVISMMITGLSASYCGIIGYIKLRDFAVANSRSQPTGTFEGKSDYYLRIQDNNDPSASTGTTTNQTSYVNNASAYRLQTTYSSPNSAASSSYHHSSNPGNPTIYQSDGTPQFWGTYIYKPTQAAVAVSNR